MTKDLSRRFALASRNKPVQYDMRRCKRRNRTKKTFVRLKHWHRIAIGYDRCPKVFLWGITLAATNLFWLQTKTSGT